MAVTYRDPFWHGHAGTALREHNGWQRKCPQSSQLGGGDGHRGSAKEAARDGTLEAPNLSSLTR
jgi:hypothetical protein